MVEEFTLALDFDDVSLNGEADLVTTDPLYSIRRNLALSGAENDVLSREDMTEMVLFARWF